MIDYLNPVDLGDFSQQGLSSGTASDVFVYAAGLALDPVTMARREDAESIADETRICLGNVSTILAEAGLTLRDVVKTTCYLQDEAHRFEFLDAYKGVFGEGPYPARSTFVLGIASNLRVQIEAVAVRPDAC
ncbi:RidA family protein [Rhodococcus opacus]|uniref:RidA family protein n=1 Tax=Rhodococcus opacus TaxID=37919 RepID=UPI001C45D1C7|nr:RidA family protein [Rhodococcus opacus]MBV6759805.1 RidA family protein [Rhodococcus opacus]